MTASVTVTVTDTEAEGEDDDSRKEVVTNIIQGHLQGELKRQQTEVGTLGS